MNPRPACVVIAALLLAGCEDSPRGKAAAAEAMSGDPLSPEAVSRHVEQVKRKAKRLNGNFTVIVEHPFVLVGDVSEERLQAIAESTVRWTREKLKQDFFAKDPARILDIWLFKDAESYEAYVFALTRRKVTTPYGFYSSENGALYMNISTGLGTLVHELVHPYIEANFPACPAWLNEGLGSLYERPGERDGHIYGDTNWRLPGLQTALNDGRVPPFEALTAMDSQTFYGPGSGVHYASARYLLYYLQEQKLLVPYYRAFFQARSEDPTGYKTLARILGENDMPAFERRWAGFVMKLSFP